MKVLSVFAGPNGSGKTTLQEKYPDRTPGVTINADELSARLGNNVAGAREALLLQREQMRRGRSFSIETTLSGSSPLRLMKSARAQGYKVVLYFICTGAVELNVARVSARVALGVLN